MIKLIVISLFIFFLRVLPVSPAEVLQILSPSILQIGDGNRSYTVQLACVNVKDDLKTEAISWLRHKIPRHSKVNLRPTGSNNGFLIAKVILLGDDDDLSSKMISENLVYNSCFNNL